MNAQNCSLVRSIEARPHISFGGNARQNRTQNRAVIVAASTGDSTSRRQALQALVAGISAVGVAGKAVAADLRVGEVTRTDAEWRKLLTANQYAVLRQEATEMPFSSPLYEEHRKGTFKCAGCSSSLFASEMKYDSGTGWPSFYDALPKAVDTKSDNSIFFMPRTEVRCHKCQGHLGHVFPDGPKPTGLRYCMNGAALTFEPESA